ncbi:MAG: FG-GAP-like repeat-containing protein [Candidatus Sumerlaeaceae bacterium]
MIEHCSRPLRKFSAPMRITFKAPAIVALYLCGAAGCIAGDTSTVLSLSTGQIAKAAAVADPTMAELLERASAQSAGEDRSQVLRARYAFALKIGESGGNWQAANDILLTLLQDTNLEPNLVAKVVETLRVSGDAACVEPLLKRLPSAPPPARAQILSVLRELNGRDVTRRLLEMHPSVAAADQPQVSASLTARRDFADVHPVGTPEAPRKRGGYLRFQRQKLSEASFEAASAFDVNNDGTTDVVSGGFWYPGPDFQRAHKICYVKPSGEYYDDFSDYPIDVNGDGYKDVITGGFFGGPLRWRENPKGQSTEWTEHKIAHVGSIETTRFWDVDGDGIPEACPNAGGNIVCFRLKPGSVGEFTSHTVRTGGVGHGLGFGDLDGDGRGEFLGPDGWYKAPEKLLDAGEWKFHHDFSLGAASVPILVHDVNRDGRNDILVGQGHNYGLEWLEQTTGSAAARWIRHQLEPDRSQFHEIQLADLDNDGSPELITGKRWRAHNGNDPGAADPIGVYYYTMSGGRFERVAIDYGPATHTAGSGIYLWVEDVDGNGWKDIIAPGKQGLYVFWNQGL